jgi:serine phosphatase RsbU (regulator of sigma subunit)
MIAGLLAQVLDRCRTHDLEHRVITELQRDISGGPLADLPGLTLAGRYRPGNFGVGLGGDFYDAFTQPDGKPAMFVGDVQGHDSHAAVTASRLRIALRAYALEGHGPAQIVGHANRVLADLNGDSADAVYATCCYVSFDPARGRLALSRAGHPHPIVITDGQRARTLTADGGLPLGIDTGQHYPTSVFTIQERSTLVLYTDGLIERPGTDIETGMRDTLRELTALHSPDPGTTLAGLSSLNRAAGRFDDIAVLAARYAGNTGR